ncbi:protein of unknown function [Hymenobacter gelipurpurascens]|uniref:DUF922 domain-containing protein n=1 Tax=Hymenobacter gelipurpurascens TaxID=89968 RepID=A0A212T253_9BACT|nr:DUF922 domain-containing protein [Hymenobacter gelipurpurascens]SNC60095.1 protein of unknown function [Hymenobacter gelipurpurascens]
MLSTFSIPLLLLSSLGRLLQGPTTPAATAAKPAPAAAPTTIEWRADRRLTWEDFKARPNTDRLAALTSSTIDAKVGCIDYQFSAQVRAIFVPTESWVRNPATASPNLLRHEQLHFDITELHTRKLRQKLSLVKLDCLHLQPAFNNITKLAFLEWQREEAKYDVDTNHGLNIPRQQFWEEQTKQKLQQFEAFALK